MRQAFAEVAAAGGKYVEPAFIAGYIDFDESDFAETQAVRLRHDMTNAGVSAFAVSAHHDMGAEGAGAFTERRLGFAAAVGAQILITNATTVDRLDAFRRNLDVVLPIAERAGVAIAIENPGHGAGALVANGFDGSRLVRSIASPWLRLNYDFGNAFTYSDERTRPETDFENALPEMIHGHIKDVASSAEGWQFSAIGMGVIDYAAILRRLAKSAPTLPLGLELPLRLQRPDRQSPMRAAEPLPLPELRAALAQSFQFVAAHSQSDGDPVSKD
jgi:sugar phosphate isomerase/epimerase